MDDNDAVDAGTGGARGGGGTGVNLRGAPMSQQTDDLYNMAHSNRGTAIIFNNKTFNPITNMPSRKGSDLDAQHLYNLFTEMNFNTVLRHDCTARDMVSTIQKLAVDDHSNSDCLAVAILSHGEEGEKIYGKDKAFHLDEMVEPLRQCKSLAGKPKLFFIQACRGQKLDEGQEVADAVADADGDEMMDVEPLVYKIPMNADFLFAYSTVAGYYAWRNQERGSWFVQALCDVFSDNWRRMDVLSMMTRVSKKVAYDFESNCAGPMGSKKQVPCITSMLTRDIYFTPKK